MPNKTIKITNEVIEPITLGVKMPRFTDDKNIIVNYQLWLIYGNIKQDIGKGTNTDAILDEHRLPVSAEDLKGKLIRIDYTLINGENVDVQFYCSIDANPILKTLKQTISISCINFE